MDYFTVDSIYQLFKETWSFFSTPVIELSGSKISILSVFFALIFFYLSTIMSKYCQKMTERFLRHKDLDRGIKGSISKIAGHLAQVLGILVALDIVGINLSSLMALGGVLAVGIGFGLQNIAQNFISGLIILFERPIKKGDLVEVDGVYGRVSEIGSRSTTVTTKDDVSIIVPNSKFISEQVINDSFSGERRRFHISIGVAYSTDARKVEALLKQIALSHEKVLKKPAPVVFFKEFGDSSLNFDLTVWIEDLWNFEVILSDLRFMMNQRFEKEGIEIPFPQRDIHLRTGHTL